MVGDEKADHSSLPIGYAGVMAKMTDYQSDLRKLQIALVRYQKWAIKTGAKALVIFEGRDG
ncbi:MAG: hypothetical protein ACR2F8_11965, partial [Caulobacteraceae bacterium]